MPIITLSSNLGDKGFIVGACKGLLLSQLAPIQLIDISHHLPKHNHQRIVYILSNSFACFPIHSYHIILHNYLVNNPTQLLIAYYQQQYIICIDNGIIPHLLPQDNNSIIIRSIPIVKDVKHLLSYVQLIASTLKDIIYNHHDIKDIGYHPLKMYDPPRMQTIIGKDYIETNILHIDSFGNVVLNISKDVFESARMNRNIHIQIQSRTFVEKINEKYFDVALGEPLAWFNNFNYLELAIREGNMSELFGLRLFDTPNLPDTQLNPINANIINQKITIYFH